MGTVITPPLTISQTHVIYNTHFIIPNTYVILTKLNWLTTYWYLFVLGLEPGVVVWIDECDGLGSSSDWALEHHTVNYHFTIKLDTRWIYLQLLFPKENHLQPYKGITAAFWLHALDFSNLRNVLSFQQFAKFDKTLLMLSSGNTVDTASVFYCWRSKVWALVVPWFGRVNLYICR